MIKYLIMIIREKIENKKQQERNDRKFAACELAKKGFGR